MCRLLTALLVALAALLAGCQNATPVVNQGRSGQQSPTLSPTPGPAASSPVTAPSKAHVTKVLTVIEENHSLAQMKSGMPYLYGLAQRYAYADHYTAQAHPSLPDYLAIAGGDTFGISDDDSPAAHEIHGPSIFGQALDAGLAAGTYAESMPENCALVGNGDKGYAVRHNPWAYFVDERSACAAHDVPDTAFLAAAKSNSLPNAALLIPNTCNDAHDGRLGCSLQTADGWLQGKLTVVLESEDFRSGRLAVIVTADEDDSASDNVVLTVVLQASLDRSHRIISTPLTHYSLSRFYSQVVGAQPLRHAAKAPDLAAAFGLTTR